ncbi:HNH endonuclease [Sorangium sp. So ce296]|uniref:HNH endonuclease n=1 Tax=Sorangium sp. So ce296 TaxID=3133296 RepID=UPI003F61CD21
MIARAAGVVSTEVKIAATGSLAGFSRTTEGYTWHHQQDGMTIQLSTAAALRQTQLISKAYQGHRRTYKYFSELADQ